MANPEHLDIVKRGDLAIGNWRGDHPHERLDLNRAQLRKSRLREADLREADLRGADLRGADLFRTSLVGADLVSADLSGSRLTGADLAWAQLDGADLRAANLQMAILLAANLGRANLLGADLSGAVCHMSVFAACDLSRLRGLETVRQDGPSMIGVDTLVLTLNGAGGHFTAEQRTFFENAGVPKTLLDYLPSLLESHPIQFFSCFISFGADDEKFADRLYGDLKERGVSCWKYDEDALVGRGVWANIDQAIRLHGKTIVICSQSSLQRPGVQREIERTLQREDELKRDQAARPDANIDTDVLFPVRLDDYVLEGWQHERQPDVVAKNIGDFRGWDEDNANYLRGLEQLLRALDPRSRLGLSKGDLRQLGEV